MVRDILTSVMEGAVSQCMQIRRYKDCNNDLPDASECKASITWPKQRKGRRNNGIQHFRLIIRLPAGVIEIRGTGLKTHKVDGYSSKAQQDQDRQHRPAFVIYSVSSKNIYALKKY